MDQLSVARPTGAAAAMTSKSRTTAVLLTVGALVLIGSPALGLGWTTVPSPSEIPGDNYLYGADASDASNVWAVGVVYPPTGGTRHGLALRYDGAAWRSVPRTGLPGDDTLRGVKAISATDVWVAGDHRAGISGYDTMVAHWNGTTWTRESTPNGNPGGLNNLYGVAAASGTVWAVGTYVGPNSS